MFPAALLQSRNIAPWDSIQAQIAALPAAADAQAIRSRQSLMDLALSDGSTTNRRIDWSMGAAGNVAGSALSEVGYILRVPTANPTTRAAIFFYSAASAPGDVYNATNTLVGFLENSGALVIRNMGNPVTDIRTATYAGFRAAYSGQLVRLDFVFTSGAANPAIYANGTDISASFVFSSGGVPPNWMHAALASNNRVAGFNWPALEIRPGAPINRALSAAEITQMMQAGALLPSDRLGGSCIALINDATLNGGFESAGGGGGTAADFANCWGGAAITTVAETVDVGAGARSLRLTGGGALSSTASNHLAVGTTANGSVTGMVSGARYRLAFRAKYISGGGNLESGIGFIPGRTVTPAEAAAWTQFSAEVVATTSSVSPRFAAAAGAVWLIDSVEVHWLGALVQPEITRTAQVLDHGPNRIRGVMFAGVRPLSERDPVGIRGTSSATGFALGLGASDSLWFESGIITGLRIKQSVAAAQTITLRLNTSGGTTIATIVTAANTDWQLVPLVIPGGFEVSAGDRLHFTQTGAAFDWNVDWSRR